MAAGAVQRELDGVWPEEALRLVARSGLLVDPGSCRPMVDPTFRSRPPLRCYAFCPRPIRPSANCCCRISCSAAAIRDFEGSRPGTADLSPTCSPVRKWVMPPSNGAPVQSCGTTDHGGPPRRGRMGAQRQQVLRHRCLGASWIAVAARIPDTEPSHGATVFVRPADRG